MITDYLIHKLNLVHIFILIDSSLPPQGIDIDFIQWIHQERKPYSLVFTKTDKNTQKQTSYNMKQRKLLLGKAIPWSPGYYVTSGLKPHSTQAIIDDIHNIV
jgi:GTP-binding protein